MTGCSNHIPFQIIGIYSLERLPIFSLITFPKKRIREAAVQPGKKKSAWHLDISAMSGLPNVFIFLSKIYFILIFQFCSCIHGFGEDCSFLVGLFSVHFPFHGRRTRCWYCTRRWSMLVESNFHLSWIKQLLLYSWLLLWLIFHIL